MNKKKNLIAFNILLRKDGPDWVAHCLELDIVTTGDSQEEAGEEIKDLIAAQVEYAFSHDNVENLYRPAPKEVWKEFYECRTIEEKTVEIPGRSDLKDNLRSFVPPWIITKTSLCTSGPNA